MASNSKRQQFVESQSSVKRKPKQNSAGRRDATVFNSRNYRLGIRKGASKKRLLKIRYVKTSTDEQKTYIIEPYSYRYRYTRNGLRKMLFAHDVNDGHIKGFVLRMIKGVEILDNKFKPKWRVEISK